MFVKKTTKLLKIKKGFLSQQNRFYARQDLTNFDPEEDYLPNPHNPHTNFRVATVFGATGFVGKYICADLAKKGYQVIVPWRKDEMAIREHQIMGDIGQIVPMRFHSDYFETLKDICSRSNIVVNAAGRDFDKYGDTMELANVKFAESIARACAETGVERLFHVSINGADEQSSSVYLKTKAQGEKVVRKHYPSATILRPTTVFGMEDKFLQFYARCIRIAPGVPMVDRARSLIQPVFVGDVARSITACLSDPFLNFQGKTFYLGGPKKYKLYEIMKTIADLIDEPYYPMPMMKPIAQIAGYVNEFTWKPIWTRDLATRLLQDDIVPENVRGFEELKITPEKMEDTMEFVVARFKRHTNYFMNVSKK
eukprot:gene5126-8724_t